MAIKVWLDAGHGGKDVGAVGNGLEEATVVLAVTMEIGRILQEHGVIVGYSRTSDIYVGLSERASKANKWGAGIFVSVHANSFSKETARGLETYHYPNAKDGQKLSTEIHNSIKADKLYSVDRGIKSADFAVLRETHMTASLVELAFISNSGDSLMLRHKQKEFARAIARGILRHVGIKYLPDRPVVPVVPEKPVEDVSDGSHWVDGAVDELAKLGITFTDKRYNETATRAEVIQMLWNAIKQLKQIDG